MGDRLEDQRTQYLWVHSSIDDMTDLSPNAMRVYMHLVRRANGAGVAWPSYQSIGDHCFISVSEKEATRKTFARNAIDELIAAGLIRKEERMRDDGSQTSNAYALVNPAAPSTPVLNRHAPCLDSTPRAYQAPEGNSIEGNPIKNDDDDNARARGEVIKSYEQNIGVIPPLVGEQLHALMDEVGQLSVMAGILAAANQNKRSFAYMQKCARNHANGVEKPTARDAPRGGDYAPQHRTTNRGLKAVQDYMRKKGMSYEPD